MLTSSFHTRNISRYRQQGVVLVITLIMLVAMTLAVIAMVRSVDTSNLIAGNLAFQQSALLAADQGAESAANTLLPSLANSLTCTVNCPQGYLSWRQPNREPPVISWEEFWGDVRGSAVTLQLQDAANNLTGYTAYYVVQAMCDENGQGGCLTPPPSASVSCEGNDLGKATQGCTTDGQKYYRVTTRVEGPRNSIAYIQTMIAM
jgi:type IV pilus assembly protein PilX